MAPLCLRLGAFRRADLDPRQVRDPQDRLDRRHRTADRRGLALRLAPRAPEGGQGQLGSLDGETVLFLVLSGLATGGSWLCYFKALQGGPASVVVPIDKLSLLVTVLFSFVVFHERLSPKAVVAGTLLLLL